MAFLIEPKLFASNLRYYRERESYSLRQLADRADLATTVIQALEAGTTLPSNAQLDSIARALQVRGEQLVLPRPPEQEYLEGC